MNWNRYHERKPNVVQQSPSSASWDMGQRLSWIIIWFILHVRFFFLFRERLYHERSHTKPNSADFELGRLRACMGDEPDARKHFEMILSGKVPEVNAAGRKGKYSLEVRLFLSVFWLFVVLKEVLL